MPTGTRVLLPCLCGSFIAVAACLLVVSNIADQPAIFQVGWGGSDSSPLFHVGKLFGRDNAAFASSFLPIYSDSALYPSTSEDLAPIEDGSLQPQQKEPASVSPAPPLPSPPPPRLTPSPLPSPPPSPPPIPPPPPPFPPPQLPSHPPPAPLPASSLSPDPGNHDAAQKAATLLDELQPVAGVTGLRCKNEKEPGCDYETLVLLENAQIHNRWEERTQAIRRQCQRIDPNHDYSEWETPTFYAQVTHLAHGDFDRRWPEAWRRPLTFGMGTLNAKAFSLRRALSGILGDSLAHGEPFSMSLVRLLLQGRQAEFTKEHPSPVDFFLDAKHYNFYLNTTFRELGKQIKQVPGISEAAATCRARLFMDHSIKRTPGVLCWDDPSQAGNISKSQVQSPGRGATPEDFFTWMTVEPDFDQFYSSAWPLMGGVYGADVVTLRPDTAQRFMSPNEYLREFDDLHWSAGRLKCSYWLYSDICIDQREVLMPGYIEPGHIVKYEYSMGTRNDEFSYWRDGLFYGIYQVKDEEYPDIGVALHWAVNPEENIPPCTHVNAAGIITRCIPLGLPRFQLDFLCMDEVQNTHWVSTNEPVPISGALYALPTATSSPQNNEEFIRCVAARVLRRQLASADLSAIEMDPELVATDKFLNDFEAQVKDKRFVDGSATMHYLPAYEMLGRSPLPALSESHCSGVLKAVHG